MGLNDQLKTDIEQITTNTNEWGEVADFEAPTGEEASVAGLFTEHCNTYDDMGKSMDTQISSFCVSEVPLIAQYYPTRDGAGFVHFDKHLLTIAGKRYIVMRWKHDELASLTILFLTEYDG